MVHSMIHNKHCVVNRVSSKILKVVAPASTYSSKDNSGVIVIDEDSDSAEEEERFV